MAFVRIPGARFLRVDFEEAIGICGYDDEAWEFIVPGSLEKDKTLTRKGEVMVMKDHGGVAWLTVISCLSLVSL